MTIGFTNANSDTYKVFFMAQILKKFQIKTVFWIRTDPGVFDDLDPDIKTRIKKSKSLFDIKTTFDI